VNIGSFFVFDNVARPNGLSEAEKKGKFQLSCSRTGVLTPTAFCETAKKIMRHLESKREVSERRRVALMSKGVSQFLERTTHLGEVESEEQEATDTAATTPAISQTESEGIFSSVESHIMSSTTQSSADGFSQQSTNDFSKKKKGASEIVLDKIKITLDHAAEILRQSLELKHGGVVFLDTAVGYSEPKNDADYFELKSELEAISEKTGDVEEESSKRAGTDLSMTGIDPRTAISPGQVRGYNDEYLPARVLALSASKGSYKNRHSKVLDGKTLQTFIDTYPKGNIWYIDQQGYFSSLDQLEQTENGISSDGKSGDDAEHVKSPNSDFNRQFTEAMLLQKVFHNAKQIMFLPLWDARASRWHSGCFVWTNHAYPVFTVDSELSFVSALANSVMVEISRLDSITANNMKSDFISSISHEFRSPLHGILASAEFLHDSDLDTTQLELVSTIQTCGSTLLDTINHVLDYSKINSFEKKSPTGALSNELDNVSNVALLCEDIVNGIIAAREFGGIQATMPYSQPIEQSNPMNGYDQQVEIILDFEDRDWNFKVQPGALRRIIMNIFGNAQKYTERGFIFVQLRLRHAERTSNGVKIKDGQKVLALNIIDSGRGMSQQYMERKLYTPFAQEDSFAPGIGLGLSIVRSIVNQLGGKINIRSELGKGTDVEVLLPLEDPTPEEIQNALLNPSNASGSDMDSIRAVQEMKEISRGKTVAIWRDSANVANRNKNLAWSTVEAYCRHWFGFHILPGQDLETLAEADIVIKERVENGAVVQLPDGEVDKVLFLQNRLGRVMEPRSRLASKISETIALPIGPFKLARSLLALFKPKELRSKANFPDNAEVVDQRPQIEEFLDAEYDNNGSDDTVLPTILSLDIDLSTPTPTQENVVRSLKENGVKALGDENSSLSPKKIPSLSPKRPTLQHTQSVAPSRPRPRPDPRSQLSLPSLNGPALSSPTSSNIPLHILAVDDNSLNLLLLTRYLAKRPHDTIATARNGVEAVNAVKNAATPFDVIFMDISMPAMDGFEATRLIRAWERDVRVARGEELDRLDRLAEEEQNEREREDGGMVRALEGLGIVAKEGTDSPREAAHGAREKVNDAVHNYHGLTSKISANENTNGDRWEGNEQELHNPTAEALAVTLMCEDPCNDLSPTTTTSDSDSVKQEAAHCSLPLPPAEHLEISALKSQLSDLVPLSPEEAADLIKIQEAAKEQEQGWRSAYIVALTGLASRRDREEAVQSGFDDFLTKPISFGMIGELLGWLSGKVEARERERGSGLGGRGRGESIVR
jgi:signal transduction histidine kinase/CheY-like chemotaxis protein